MATLTVEDVEVYTSGYRVHWSVDEDYRRLFYVQPLDISYDFPLNPDATGPVQSLLALTLPVLANEYRRVRIRSKVPISVEFREQWSDVTRSLRIHDFHFEWDAPVVLGRNPGSTQSPSARFGRIGILFGGGVESMFALSVLYHHRPVLISIVGDGWMNNDLAHFRIKRELEDRLIAKFDLDFHRITSNAFALLRRGDLYKNYFMTGFLFYWQSVPVCDALGITTLYKSSELEEALNFDDQDLSLHPRFLKHIMHVDGPLYLPLFNCYAKIQMLADLAKTPFVSYIYSCYNNSGKRWCGQCSKCYRISEFCERLGLDRSIIGMQEGIIGRRETGSISRHYWELTDQIYGRRRAHEVGQFAQYLRRYGRHIVSSGVRRVARQVLSIARGAIGTE